MSGAYLKIENPGVAPTEAFTLLGASTKTSFNHPNLIGKFGSGAKHAIAVLLRWKLPPIVFCDMLRMDFGTRPQKVSETNFERVVVKFGGKDKNGRNKSATEDLGFVVDYGAQDWGTPELALREAVSNAIDESVLQAEQAFIVKTINENEWVTQGKEQAEMVELLKPILTNYRKQIKGFRDVVVEVVGENQVRARSGHTRIFVPLNSDVMKFYDNLGKWFLHFSEPHLLKDSILPKGHNMGDSKSAAIYRRGVFVREVQYPKIDSVFDYNLENLKLDESRKVDDHVVASVAAQALRDTTPKNISKVLKTFVNREKSWESQFQSWYLNSSNVYDDEKKKAIKENWQEAFRMIAGDKSVIAINDSNAAMAERKGYNVVVAPEAYVNIADDYELPTISKVLNSHDRKGTEVLTCTSTAQWAVNKIWSVIEKYNMTNGKEKPTVATFKRISEGGEVALGYYEKNVVYLSITLAGEDAGLSHELMQTALEEVSHHVTGSTDNSRDFQEYAFNLATHLIMEK